MKTAVRLMVLLFFVAWTNNYDAKNIKMFLIYTESHNVFLDNWFLSSLKDDFQLVHNRLNQVCKSGEFMKEGWLDLMRQRLDILIKAVEDNMGDIIVYSDIDIQFFRPFKDMIDSMMEGKDILVQRNAPRGTHHVVCAGFYLCRCNERTLKLHQKIKQYMLDHPGYNDQDAMEYYLRENNVDNVQWALLPDTFYNPGMYSDKRWVPGDQLQLPENMILHHACWTVGIENKIKQFKYVKDFVLSKEKLQDL